MITKGSIVTFGKYFQTSNATKDDIEWIVLDRNDEEALLVSKYILDTKAYNDQRIDITWENCTLRKWLNSTFLNEAFSSKEQSYIKNSRIKNDDNLHPLRMVAPEWMQQYNPYRNTVSGGNDTIDKVFILSWEEAIKYFPNHPNSDKMVMDTKAVVASFRPKDMTVVARALSGINVDATEYAKSHNLDIYAGSATIWFRSPGNTSQMAVVTMMGDILYRPGCEVDDATNGVRPAIWVYSRAFMEAEKTECVREPNEEGQNEKSNSPKLDPQAAAKIQDAFANIFSQAIQMGVWRHQGVCQYCGGEFGGFFIKKCCLCGKKKDY